MLRCTHACTLKPAGRGAEVPFQAGRCFSSWRVCKRNSLLSHATRAGGPSARRPSTAPLPSANGTPAAPQEAQRLSPEEIDDFNRVTTRAMRVFLKEDRSAAASCADEVVEVAAKYMHKGNQQASTFLLALYSLLQHNMPARVVAALGGAEPEPGQVVLQGQYLDAFNRIYALVEDAGWKVVVEGQEGQEAEDDELLMPPPNMNPYAR